jgi:hypothetical protein
LETKDLLLLEFVDGKMVLSVIIVWVDLFDDHLVVISKDIVNVVVLVTLEVNASLAHQSCLCLSVVIVLELIVESFELTVVVV